MGVIKDNRRKGFHSPLRFRPEHNLVLDCNCLRRSLHLLTQGTTMKVIILAVILAVMVSMVLGANVPKKPDASEALPRMYGEENAAEFASRIKRGAQRYGGYGGYGGGYGGRKGGYGGGYGGRYGGGYGGRYGGYGRK